MRFERRGNSGGGFGGGRRFGGRPMGGGRDRDDMPKPVKVGEEYDVEISEVGSRGDGIARVKNFVVFVNGAKQGEKTRIKITSVSSRFATGEKTSGSGETSEIAEETEAPSTEDASEGTVESSESEEGEE